ncbi:ubiquitin fusion degradation protein [Aspergillus sp. HF37]|nr:ubiquitin fusion degradation protein [Aspergillus sp. HF37]
MTDSEPALRWSSQLRVTPPSQSPKLPGDKIILPQSALEQLLAAAPLHQVESQVPRGLTSAFDPFNPHTLAAETRAREYGVDRQHHLPHPLMFRVVNPQNERMIYAGIREFSARENEVSLSAALRDALGIEDSQFQPSASSGNGPEWGDGGGDGDMDGVEAGLEHHGPVVAVHAHQLPKGTYVRLRPLAAGYDPEDWKALLERYLRDNFTTLTVGEVLTVSGGRGESFQFLVDRVEPQGDGICVVDTDLEVDIVALTEDQARETLQKRLEKAARGPGTNGGSSIGGVVSLGEVIKGQVVPGEYVDYELREWNRDSTVDVELETRDNTGVYIFASPLSTRQRERPRDDIHVFGDFSTRPSKRIRIHPTNVEMEGAEALYISVNGSVTSSDEEASRQPLQYDLRAVTAPPEAEVDEDKPADHDPDDVQCKNCQQWVPQRTFMLHENFCLRNNALCEQCGNVFQRRSPEWQNHWHCVHDSSHGNDAQSKHAHDTISHTTYTCPNCSFETDAGLPSLANHRTTLCPGKPILCRFCHLVVPQQGESEPAVDDAEVILSGLTPHELIDGGRTTECHLCSKIIRLRDMTTHLRHHDLERLSRRAPRVCLNQNCGRTLDSRGGGAGGGESLGLCSICFGPLYVDTYDPEGKALRRRIDRRYLSQLMTGCGKGWCQNEYCKTGRQNKHPQEGQPSLNAGEITQLVRPLIDAVNLNRAAEPNTAPFYFCTDQVGQQRRNVAEMLAAPGAVADDRAYDLAWCVGAVDASGGNPERAREWLATMAPARGETVQ